jgi:enediyne biosynthesis protein E4
LLLKLSLKRFGIKEPIRAGAIAAAFAVFALAFSGFFADFRDEAENRGLNLPNTYGGRDRKQYILETTGNGAAIFDYDGDGFNDILITNGTTLAKNVSEGRSTVQLYRNDGSGHFSDVSAKAGFNVEGWAQGVCVGDYDNDGNTDVLITYYGHNRLYRNQGDGTFRDVTGQSGLPASGTRFGSGCSFVDYDRDGLLDFVVANYADIDLNTVPKPGSGTYCEWKGLPVMCGPRGLPEARNYLYHNRGNGTFEDVSEKAGLLKAGKRYGLGVVAADFDNDGWPDIYIACDMTPSLFFRNKHDGTFEERAVAAGVAYNFDGQLQAGMGVAVADYDSDGRLDIAKTNFSGDLPSLFHNDDGKFFTDVSQQAGLASNHLLGWGISFADFDEDGRPDLIIANGHVYPEVDKSAIGESYRQRTLVYRNMGGGKFADMTDQAGPAFKELRPARGLAVGDVTGDGRPAVVIVNMNQTPGLLVNHGARGHYLYLRLRGTKSNRSAIGARVMLDSNGQKQTGEVMSGGSFYSQNDLNLHFGLGAAQRVDKIEVRWPSGATQSWQNIPANQRLAIVEGEPQYRKF